MNDYEYREGWYALLLSILRFTTPEQSFQILTGTRWRNKYHHHHKWKTEDLEYVQKLWAEGYTWEQLNDVYGYPKNSSAFSCLINRRIKDGELQRVPRKKRNGRI